jgi:hypothetical protein
MDLVQSPRALRHEPGHHLVVTGDDDLLAPGHAVQQLPEAGLGLERSDPPSSHLRK